MRMKMKMKVKMKKKMKAATVAKARTKKKTTNTAPKGPKPLFRGFQSRSADRTFRFCRALLSMCSWIPWWL